MSVSSRSIRFRETRKPEEMRIRSYQVQRTIEYGHRVRQQVEHQFKAREVQGRS